MHIVSCLCLLLNVDGHDPRGSAVSLFMQPVKTWLRADALHLSMKVRTTNMHSRSELNAEH